MTSTRRGRKPDPAVDSAIGEAVLDLLVDRGFQLTYDEVATKAGVGRATVFRRFPTKRDMIVRAVSQASVERVDAPDTGSLRGDLCALFTSVMEVFGQPRTRAVARHLLAEAYRDEAFTDILRANLDGRLELIGTVLARGVERGELPPSPATPLIADLLSGILSIRLATDSPLPDGTEIAQLVDGLVRGFALPGKAFD